jgi:prepilin-type N-terminal cleavage/methylation domain-containing protein
MPRKSPCLHPGFTLIEVMIVMAILLILGAMVVPTLMSTERDLPIKSAGDTMRARLNDARSLAIEHGQTIRFSLSPDGKKVRFAVDADQNSASDSDLTSEYSMPRSVTARIINDESGEATLDSAGWTRVATFQPDGTCRETVVEVELNQPNCYALIVRLRGLTGNVQVIKRARGVSP